MKLTQDHINFEKLSQQLVGLTINDVEYSEIIYDPSNPNPSFSTQFTNLDSVDFSIFFHTKENKLIEIYWDDKFFQFGIGIKINSPSDFSGNIKWNVSEYDLWKKFIGEIITGIDITWESITVETNTNKVEKFVYPQDLKITFSNNKNIFISASEFKNQDAKEVYGMSDNLIVTDNEELARRVKMLI